MISVNLVIDTHMERGAIPDGLYKLVYCHILIWSESEDDTDDDTITHDEEVYRRKKESIEDKNSKQLWYLLCSQ